MKPRAERIDKGLWWDRAWKLVEGCSPVSPGCDHCWSAREAHMRANNPNTKIKEQYEGLTDGVRWNGQIRLLEKNLDLPLRVKKTQVWAVWNDLFHEDVPNDWIDQTLWEIGHTHQRHLFLILTKRPERMRDWFIKAYNDNAPYRNLWLGVTAENQATANERIPLLLQTPAAVRFASIEPMLSAIDLTRIGGDRFGWGRIDTLNGLQYTRANATESGCEWETTPCAKLDQIICGGESGPGARPMHPDWPRSLRDQCVAAGVPFFLKQMHINGKLVKMPELDGKKWSELPNV